MAQSNDDEDGSDPDLSETSADEDDSVFRGVLQEVARADPRTPPVFLAKGTRLGPYRIVDRLGRGGMGVVYRSVDTRLGREVALKVLRGAEAGDERRRRFLREARSAAAINHPNVATIYDVGEADDHVYLAMELIEGETLRRRLIAGGLGVDEGARIAREIALGLAPAHAKGIVHRDLKPENVMVTRSGSVKVLDFGLAKLRSAAKTQDESFGHRETETRDGAVLGTPAYMAPEQAMGEAIDARADVFALGVVLYEMVTGVRPSLLGAGPEIHDQRLEDIVRKAIASSPAERFANAGEMLTALNARASLPPDAAPTSSRAGVLDSTPPIDEPTPDAFAQPHKPTLRQRPAMLFGVLAAAAGLLSLMIIAAWRASPTRATSAMRDVSTTAAPDAAMIAVPSTYFERRLTAYSADTLVKSLAVSPDGQTYAFAAGDLLQVAAVDGSARHRVTLPSAEKGAPRHIEFLPDGQRLLVGEFSAGNNHTWVVSLDGSPPERARDAVNFALSPDGTSIAYRYNRDVFVAPVMSGKATYIESVSEDDTEISWSPDGSRLAIVRTVDESGLLEVAHADGSSRKTIATGIRFEMEPARAAWMANDRLVYQEVSPDRILSLMELTLDGASNAPIGVPRRLWTRPAGAVLTKLQYRSRRFFFIKLESQSDLYVGRLNAQQRFEVPLSRLTTSDDNDHLVGWLPNGRLVYWTEGGGVRHTVVGSVNDKEGQTVLGGEHTTAFAVSSDGRVLALRNSPQFEGTTVLSLGAGAAESRDLFTSKDMTFVDGVPAFCARCANNDARRCVVGIPSGAETSFSLFDSVSGVREPTFAHIGTANPGLCSLSADGKSLFVPDEDGKVKVATVLTGAVRTVSAHGAFVQSVNALSGSSDMLVSGMNIDGHQYGLARMSPDGSRVDPIWTSDTLWVSGPQIAPNGRDIAVTGRSIDSDVYMLEPADSK